MSAITQFVGGRKIATVVNYDSAGGKTTASISGPAGCKTYASASVAANALQTMLSVTGRGCLNFVNAYAGNTTSRTIRIQITIDGVVVFNATSAAITASNTGLIAVGAVVGNGGLPTFQPVRFYSSCLVEIASSVLNDSTNITTAINYETDA